MMIIISFAAKSLTEYLICKEKLGREERPKWCWSCDEWNCYWRHGHFMRFVQEESRREEVLVERFKCKRCGKTVSILPCFVVPRRRYTMKLIAQGIENYAIAPTTYKDAATKLGLNPSVSQLFRWTALLSKRANELLLDEQSQCVVAGVAEEELENAEKTECPNAWRVRIEKKDSQLNALAKVVSFGKLVFQGVKGIVLEQLGMLFLKNVYEVQQIFAHQSYWKSTPQKMKPELF